LPKKSVSKSSEQPENKRGRKPVGKGARGTTPATKKKTAGSPKKNKLGVKNSLVNNINAKKKKGTSRPAKKSTISRKAYNDMEKNWGRKSK